MRIVPTPGWKPGQEFEHLEKLLDYESINQRVLYMGGDINIDMHSVSRPQKEV